MGFIKKWLFKPKDLKRSDMSWEDFIKMNYIGKRYHEAHISQCKVGNANLGKGIDWTRNPGSLVIHGAVGTGKTHFLLSLAREAVRLYGVSSVRHVKGHKLDERTIRNPSLLYGFCTADILFIDDIVLGNNPDMYDELIDERWSNKRPTVITTDKTPEEVAKLAGHRIYSRLKDYTWLHLDGPDLRGV